MQKPIVTHFFDTATNIFSYVVKGSGSNACAIIDSVLDFDNAAADLTVSAVKYACR